LAYEVEVSEEVQQVAPRTIAAALVFFVVSATPVWSQTIRNADQRAIDDGSRLVAQGRYEEALKSYEKVSPAFGETYATALYNIGVCNYELWHTTEAIEFYRRAIHQRAGNYPKASYALGVALEDLKRIPEAVEAYKQALATSGGVYAPANYRLGVITALAGDATEAARLFRKALDHSGEHVPASHNNLGVMLTRLDRLAEAEKEFTIALRLSNGSFLDAAHNLKLCRQLMSANTGVANLSTMRVTNRID
jgi:tetratricopeptide (TPR) repeat protein